MYDAMFVPDDSAKAWVKAAKRNRAIVNALIKQRALLVELIEQIAPDNPLANKDRRNEIFDKAMLEQGFKP
jgi:hypothetical protein